MQTLARWSFLDRRMVVAMWLLSFVALMAASALVGSHYEDNLSLPGTQSDRAVSLLHKAAPRAGDVDQVVFAVESGSVTDAATKQRIESALTAITVLPHVSGVASPFRSIGGQQIR